MTPLTILWRGILLPGAESCRLCSHNSGWRLEGTAVFSHEGRPCRLDYGILCDSAWETRSAQVKGWLAGTAVDVQLTAGAGHHWRLNGVEQPAVAGCIDVDLNFSPSTNLLPIRRLGLRVGESAGIRAAWLRFPGFELEPLEQRYTRLDEPTYRYESGGGSFVADLQVDAAGFVTDYPGIWRAEAASA